MPVVHKAGPGKAILERALASIDGRIGRVGWFSSAKYEDGTSVAYIASIHEFGYPTGGITPRLGLRNLVKDKRPQWSAICLRGAKAVFKGETQADYILHLIGSVAVGDIQKHIAHVQYPVLAPRTLEARAYRMHIKPDELTGTGAKPLVEPVVSKKQGGGPGGILLSHVTYDVTDKGNDK